MREYLEVIGLVLGILAGATLVSFILRKVLFLAITRYAAVIKADPTNFSFLKNSVSFVISIIAFVIIVNKVPSLKSMSKEDVLFVKDQIKQIVPDMMDKGAYFAVKEAFKRVLPHQYEMLKELKDTLIERNSVQNM